VAMTTFVRDRCDSGDSCDRADSNTVVTIVTFCYGNGDSDGNGDIVGPVTFAAMESDNGDTLLWQW
jgi:hypothetical protein